MALNTPSVRREWVFPIVTLLTIAFITFTGLFTLDHFATGGPPPPEGQVPSLFDRYFLFDDQRISDAVSALAGMVAAVLGIVITVVSIVVQLSANRYTGVAAMFFRDRLNIAVMGFYVVACVDGIWLSVSLRDHFVPRVTLVAMLVSATICLVVMAPYFAYVFRFLEPANIVSRIRSDAVRMAKLGATTGDTTHLADLQASTLTAMEELTDIASNAISGKDKIIASNAVDALRDFAIEYVRGKRDTQKNWFKIGDLIRMNPDFVAMDPESLADLEQRNTWVEWKAMRQYMAIYNEALLVMRDINYLIAIDTRYLGEAAIVAGDQELMTLVVRYMNSYMRSTINAKEVRVAYNILNQYRLLVEAFLRGGRGDMALQAVGHMKYYGHVCFDMKLTFITETIAYDVCALCCLASELKCPQEVDLLDVFLDLDRPSIERGQEQGLKGVRKAQVKLAAFYLTVGKADYAKRIQDDMAAEPLERLQAIRSELEKVTSKDFWEIIDRGRNFEYMPPEQKNAMKLFFERLGAVSPESIARPRMGSLSGA